MDYWCIFFIVDQRVYICRSQSIKAAIWSIKIRRLASKLPRTILEKQVMSYFQIRMPGIYFLIHLWCISSIYCRRLQIWGEGLVQPPDLMYYARKIQGNRDPHKKWVWSYPEIVLGPRTNRIFFRLHYECQTIQGLPPAFHKNLSDPERCHNQLITSD